MCSETHDDLGQERGPAISKMPPATEWLLTWVVMTQMRPLVII